MAMGTRKTTKNRVGSGGVAGGEICPFWKGSYFCMSENKNAKKEYKVSIFMVWL